VQKFSGAPNGARKSLNPLILGLFRREAAKIFGGVFENFGIFPQNLEFFPPLVFPLFGTRGGETQRYGLIRLISRIFLRERNSQECNAIVKVKQFHTYWTVLVSGLPAPQARKFWGFRSKTEGNT